MQISERLFRRMARDVDDQHRAAMQTFHADQHAALALAVDRRRFVIGSAVGGAALAVGASALPGFARAAGAQSAPSAKDLAIFAASVELVAVVAYETAAKSGLVKTKAVGDAAAAFMGHHKDHANAFAAVAGKPIAEIKANPKLAEEVTKAAGGLKSEADVLKLAFDLENEAAATYLFALGVLDDTRAIALMSSVLPIESSHAVVLGQALGLDAAKAPDYLPGLESDQKKLDPAKYPVG